MFSLFISNNFTFELVFLFYGLSRTSYSQRDVPHLYHQQRKPEYSKLTRYTHTRALRLAGEADALSVRLPNLCVQWDSNPRPRD